MAPEEDSNQTNESSGDDAAGPVCGGRLAAARHARGISVIEIAKELHLDEPKVRALEENRFDALGAPVFAKGHMRKYANLVGVPIDDILADYYGLNRSVGAPPVVGPPRKIPREVSPGSWVGGTAVILVVAAAAWWWFNMKPESGSPAVRPATLAPFESDPQNIPSEQQEDPAANLQDDEPAIEDELIGLPVEEAPDFAPIETTPEPGPDIVAVEEAPDVANEPAANNVELVLSYAGDCWTEVTDATGRRLYFDLGTDGRTVTLNGVGPLGVLLGDSSNVSVRVNGFDYSIPASDRRGNTARLTIYGQ